MSTSNIFNFENPRSKSPRNAFGLGFDSIFSSPAGLLMPVYVEDVKAGDKLKLGCKNFTRTRAVNTAAFMSFDEKVDFYYVPYRLLWSAYNNWMLSQTINRSTSQLTDVSNQAFLPFMRWMDLHAFFDPALPDGDTLTDIFGGDVRMFALRQLDQLNYGLMSSDPAVSLSSRYSQMSANGAQGALSVQNALNLLDNAGTLCNYFRLAAYQCIYMYAYRNEEYEALDPSYFNCDSLFYISPNISRYGHVDPVPPGFEVLNTSTPSHLEVGLGDSAVNNQGRLTLAKLFTPRYKNWRKDLYTSVKPVNGFGVNGLALSNTSYELPGVVDGTSINSGTGTSFSMPDQEGNIFQLGTDGTPSVRLGGTVDNNIVNVALQANEIRLLMAQDKFARLSLYADKDYKSQMRALFGVEVDEPDVPRYLGSFSSQIQISDVIATAAGSDGDDDASTSVLGQIAGKGSGSDSGHCFNADFKENGIVMGIHYIMPRNNYDPYRCSRFNTKVSRWDYYYPEFDGLGLQPVFLYERGWLESRDLPSGQRYYPYAGDFTSIIGFGARYAEYKQRTHEVHGVFAAGQPDEYWTGTNNLISAIGTPQAYKINPNVTDRIFAVRYNGSMATDPFLCYFSWESTRVSNMEILGVPSV